jgi:Ca2+-binding EF-hand superfamily protein
MNNKEKMSQKLLLHSNFESSRILKLNGEGIKLFTIEEDEDILSGNEGEFFNSLLVNFKSLDLNEIVNLIKILWKTLNIKEASHTITIKEFMLLFDYGKLNFSNENLIKLWKYTDINKKDALTYQEFSLFCIDLIQCLRAYHIAFYKHENNKHLQNKISSCVEIMNLHFKEYDYEGNGEITFENLKKCLLKENELFSRKEIEILLKQINPEKNFEYWKFDRILKILYLDNFNYTGLMKEDKIYRYLIQIFEKQDTMKTKKLHYKKMKYALLIEDKLKLNKVQIMVILNFFNINDHPEIEYYKASLIIRDIIAELFSSEMSIQKIDITGETYQTYENFEDVYNEHCKNIKNNFVNFDKDFDHLLSLEEFKEFLTWLIPHIDDSDKYEIFNFCDSNKDGKINYTEFKEHFPSLMNMTRIKNVFKAIGDIINEPKE